MPIPLYRIITPVLPNTSFIGFHTQHDEEGVIIPMPMMSQGGMQSRAGSIHGGGAFAGAAGGDAGPPPAVYDDRAGLGGAYYKWFFYVGYAGSFCTGACYKSGFLC